MELSIGYSPKFSRKEVKDKITGKEEYSMEQVSAYVRIDVPETALASDGQDTIRKLTEQLWPQVMASIEYQKEQLRNYYNGGSASAPAKKESKSEEKPPASSPPAATEEEQKKTVEETAESRKGATRIFTTTRDTLGWSKDTGRLFIAALFDKPIDDIDFRSLKTTTIVKASETIKKIDSAKYTGEEWLGSEEERLSKMKEVVNEVKGE